MVGDFAGPGAAGPHTRTLFTVWSAADVAPLLEELAARAPAVAVTATAPDGGAGALLPVVLAATDDAKLEAAAAWLAARLPGQPAA